MTHPKVLIVGANGKTGRRVQTRLSAAGIETRGVSRSSNPSFDWTAPETWAPALEGMDSAYLTYHPDLSVPDAQEHIRIFCEMAATAGLDHVVLLSGRNEAGAQRAEQVFRSSGLTWNIIQASWFAQNFSEDFMVEGILSGQFMVPEGTAGEPFIDIDDIADVAVATLMEPGLHNRLYEVTGPRVLSFADCIREISAATGDTVELIELPLEDYIRALREQAAPEYLIALLPDLFSQLFDGRSAHTAHGVREALGRPPTDFYEYTRKAVASGAWRRTIDEEVA